jgi:two-component system chemotaxis response regulator CheY
MPFPRFDLTMTREIQTVTATTNSDSSVDKKRLQALIVDDSRAIRSILGSLLRQIGFDVAEAGNGKEGLERLNEINQLHLVLVDWNMPVMNGLEFVQAVRADHRYDQLPLMMVTTETEMSQVARALEAGVNEYVMKPTTKDVILEKLQLLGITVP